MKVQRELDYLRREIGKLRQGLAQRPVKPPKGSPASNRSITIIGGNTLADGVTLGVKYVAAGVATVPSAYDPTVTSTFVDGIGRGTLYVNGVSQGSVLVVNDGRTGSGVSVALFASDRIGTIVTSTIPVAGDPNGATVTVYVPYWL